ncbi:MAG: pinensin family lanthipeptide [Cyclobacteriaceae bacterium]
MKTKKLNLNKLKVQSFVTAMDEATAKTAKGGAPTDHCQSDGGCGMTTNCETIDNWGDCQFHTAQAHMCSDAGCYSDYCHLTYPASDRYMV